MPSAIPLLSACLSRPARAGAGAIGLALLLAGCASTPLPPWPGAGGMDSPAASAPASCPAAVRDEGPVPAVVISTAPPTRQGVIDAARVEWDFFGNQQIDMRHEPFSSPRLGLLEDEGEAVQRVAQYWHAVGRNLTGADCQQAWSAAFISFLMVTSNVPPQDFAPNDNHFSYLDFLKQRQQQGAPAFLLVSAASTPIAPGDLICAPRGNNAAATLDDIHPGLPGHCDVVLEVHPEEGWAGVIGGNVFNSVSESLIPVDEQARLVPIAQRSWLVVGKNQLP